MLNEDALNQLNQVKQQQAFQSQGYNTFGGLTSGNSFGTTIGAGIYGGGTYFTTPTIQIVPVSVPQQVEFDYRKAVQLVYRFGQNMVQACLIKGTNDPEYAKRVFLGQFDTEEPEIVAAVVVALAA